MHLEWSPVLDPLLRTRLAPVNHLCYPRKHLWDCHCTLRCLCGSAHTPSLRAKLPRPAMALTNPLPYILPPHPTSPPWSHPQFTIHPKPKKVTSNTTTPSKIALRSTNTNTLKICIKTTPSSQVGHSLGLFSIFITNSLHISGFITYDTAQGAAMLALLKALR